MDNEELNCLLLSKPVVRKKYTNLIYTFDTLPEHLLPGFFWMIFKILSLFLLFSLVKATVPRYRFDQLMRLGWKIFLPLSLIWLVLTASFLFFLDMLPTTG